MEKIFDKEKFSKILNDIYKTYPNQRDFAHAMGTSRGYLSQYINMKFDNPPTPKILEKIANASNGLTNYNELMQVCGYTNYMVDMFFDDNVRQNGNKIPIAHEISYNPKEKKFDVFTSIEHILANFKIENNKEYFAYRAIDKAMYPLLDIDDIAIIEKCNTFEDKKTYLVSLDNELILIRKITQTDNGIELHAMNACIPIIKLTKEEMEERNFTILGKVIRAENTSAFK